MLRENDLHRALQVNAAMFAAGYILQQGLFLALTWIRNKHWVRPIYSVWERLCLFVKLSELAVHLSAYWRVLSFPVLTLNHEASCKIRSCTGICIASVLQAWLIKSRNEHFGVGTGTNQNQIQTHLNFRKTQILLQTLWPQCLSTYTTNP